MEELTSKQISEWQAYDKIDPIGTWREDLRFAKIMSFLENIVNALYGDINSSNKKSVPLDFMPKWDVEDGETVDTNKVNPEDLANALKSWARSHNRRIRKQTELRNDPPTKLKQKEQ